MIYSLVCHSLFHFICKHWKTERNTESGRERDTYCLSYAICSLALRQRVHVLLTVHTKQKLRTTREMRSRTTTKTRPLRFRLFRFRQRTADDEEMQVRGAAFANVDNATGKTHTHTHTNMHTLYTPPISLAPALSLSLSHDRARWQRVWGLWWLCCCILGCFFLGIFFIFSAPCAICVSVDFLCSKWTRAKALFSHCFYCFVFCQAKFGFRVNEII